MTMWAGIATPITDARIRAAISQRTIGDVFQPITPAETAAAAIIVDPWYPEGVVNRYGENTTPLTTDLTAAIQTALDVSLNGGRTGQLLNEGYLISAPLKIKGDNVSLIGQGWNSVIHNAAVLGEHTIEKDSSILASWTTGIFLRDFAITGTSSCGDGIRLERVAFNSGIDRLLVNTVGGIGIHLMGALEVTSHNCYATDCDIAALKLEPDSAAFSSSNANTFLGFVARESGCGIWLFSADASRGVNSNTFIGGVVEANNEPSPYDDGIRLEGLVKQNIFTGIHIEAQDIAMHLLEESVSTQAPKDNVFDACPTFSIGTDVIKIDHGFRNEFRSILDNSAVGATIAANANFNRFLWCQGLTLADSGNGTIEFIANAAGFRTGATEVVHANNAGLSWEDTGGVVRRILNLNGADKVVIEDKSGNDHITLHDGGGAQLGDGAWDGTPIQIGGAHYLWMNGNDLRGSIGAPVSATDGALIATLT